MQPCCSSGQSLRTGAGSKGPALLCKLWLGVFSLLAVRFTIKLLFYMQALKGRKRYRVNQNTVSLFTESSGETNCGLKEKEDMHEKQIR